MKGQWNLKLIKGSTPDPKPDMKAVWSNSLHKSAIKNSRMGTVLSGIKYVAISDMNSHTYMDQIENDFELISNLMELIGLLTPREFMQLFPITKTYDGERWGEKDYFYAMDHINKMNIDKPIGEERQVFDFLWDYVNWDVTSFLINAMENLDNLCNVRGITGPMDKFIEESGLTTYYSHTDEVTGQEYLINSDTGETTPVKRPKPRYLNPVR